jgi:hypothetical protein
VDHEHLPRPRGFEQLSTRTHRRPQSRDVISQRLAEAAGQKKIALHVDDDDSRSLKID